MDGPNYAAQCAIKCGEPQFQAFLCVNDKDQAAEDLRKKLQISSRKELNESSDAARRWKDALREFDEWKLGDKSLPAFLRGQSAYDRGAPISANPYRPEDGADCYPGSKANWHQGWNVRKWQIEHDQCLRSNQRANSTSMPRGPR